MPSKARSTRPIGPLPPSASTRPSPAARRSTSPRRRASCPMLGDRRLVVVLRAEKLLKPKRAAKAAETADESDEDSDEAEEIGDLTPLEDYIARPVESSTLVLRRGGDRPRPALHETACRESPRRRSRRHGRGRTIEAAKSTTRASAARQAEADPAHRGTDDRSGGARRARRRGRRRHQQAARRHRQGRVICGDAYDADRRRRRRGRVGRRRRGRLGRRRMRLATATPRGRSPRWRRSSSAAIRRTS